MALHDVQLKGYSVRPGNLSLGTFDSYGIEQLHVTLDDTWSGLAVTATFNPPKGEPVEIRVPENGLIDVPAEATANEGTGAIVYCGVANGVQLITKTQGYNVITHGNVGGTEPFNPSESLATQVLQAALNAEKNSAEANTAAQSAQTAAESAAGAAQASAESASKAAAESAAAKPYAESAKASAEAARNSENQAQQSSAEANTAKNAAQNAQAGAESSATAASKSAKEAAASAVNLDSAANTATQKAAAASASAAAAKASESAAASSEAAARKYANSAESAANTAGEAAAAAAKAKTAAQSAQADAAASKTDAANSATQANQSANAAAKSAADADNTANSIKDSMTQISENKEAVSQLKEDTAALKKRQNVLVGSETGNPISRNDAYSAPLCGLTVYGKSTQDGTPSPDNPVPIVSAGDDGSVAVKVTGKNLFPVITNANISKINKPTGGVRYGYVFYVPAQSSVTASGNADIGTNCFVGDFKLKTQTYTQKAQLVSEKGGTYTAKLQSGWYVIYIANDYLPTILTKLNAAKIQLEIGTKATVYEPYREQLLTLPTPNGLPGIPVTSGGNYTDQNGQQWVCDEVDLERGVKVQRVNAVDLSTCVITGTTNLVATKRLAILLPLKGKDYTAKALCNRLPHLVSFTSDTIHFYVDTNTAQVFIPIDAKNPEEGEYILFYVLDTPIETPLTPAEIAAYKAITAYAPDTVVQASDGAGVKLEYQRDVNLVVKNLEDAIASMTTT